MRKTGKAAPVVGVLGGLVTMLAVCCALFAMWRLTSDLGWTDTFFIEQGAFSHWQVWLALTFALAAAAIRLKRDGRAPEMVPADAVEPGGVEHDPSASGETFGPTRPRSTRRPSKAASR